MLLSLRSGPMYQLPSYLLGLLSPSQSTCHPIAFVLFHTYFATDHPNYRFFQLPTPNPSPTGNLWHDLGIFWGGAFQAGGACPSQLATPFHGLHNEQFQHKPVAGERWGDPMGRLGLGLN